MASRDPRRRKVERVAEMSRFDWLVLIVVVGANLFLLAHPVMW